ncbi:hypothetical protein VNO77_39962 [Canavalia gladiata]|uniref:Uncharacterized protein n=1 Tax=Canavalia gladiata TaxID=3824 RepID=A0AAN9JYB8_CANGL
MQSEIFKRGTAFEICALPKGPSVYSNCGGNVYLLIQGTRTLVQTSWRLSQESLSNIPECRASANSLFL